MLDRVLEPEVMDTQAEAVDYDRMDHSHVNQIFVDDFLSALSKGPVPKMGSWTIFDAGTGTAQIPIELLRRGISAKVTAADLANQMLIVARQNVSTAGFEASIELVVRDCKSLSEANETYDAVMSNSIVHHIPEPKRVFAEIWRVLKPGGLCFIRDLCRPGDLATLNHFVQTYSGEANEHQQRMFRESLHAALTVKEVRDFVRELGIPDEAVQATSDRHWTLEWKKGN